jgi:hypothetical protein
MFNQYDLYILVSRRKEIGIQGQLIIHCKSTRTEHIVPLGVILKNSGVGFHLTLCNHTILDCNGRREWSTINRKQQLVGFDLMTGNY